MVRIPIGTKREIIKNLSNLVRQLLGTLIQSGGGTGEGGGEIAANFNPDPVMQKVDVVLGTPLANNDYNIAISVEVSDGDGYAPYTESKTNTGFTLSLGTANKTGLIRVMWLLVKQ